MFTKVIVAAATVAVASAQIPVVAKRDFLLQGRQTAIDASCTDAITKIIPLYSELPTPPPSLMTATLPEDPCDTPSFTGSAASEYSSYESEVMKWYTSHSAELSSALASCSDLSQYAASVPVCSTAASATATDAGTTTSGSSSPTSDSSATDDASATESGSASGSVSQGAAPRETGYVAYAAVAAAGFMGAVAAL